MSFKYFVAIIGMLVSLQSFSAVDTHQFASEEDRLRYKTLVEELRCPKCKNNNLAGTNSQIAIDLRRELQKMVEAGDTDEQIIEFMVSRYGDFVLYRPRMTGKALYVWFGPLVLLGIGLIVVGTIVVRRRKISPQNEIARLTAEEEERLLSILAGKDDK